MSIVESMNDKKQRVPTVKGENGKGDEGMVRKKQTPVQCNWPPALGKRCHEFSCAEFINLEASIRCKIEMDMLLEFWQPFIFLITVSREQRERLHLLRDHMEQMVYASMSLQLSYTW